MNWTEAMEIAIRKTGHDRYRALCAEDNPDTRQRDGYRRIVVDVAASPDGAPQYPPMAEMVGNAIVAAAGFVASGLATVDGVEQARRLGICGACPEFDATRDRCVKCGCNLNLKSRIAVSGCPVGKW